MKALSRLVVVVGLVAVGGVLWQGVAPAQLLDEEGRRDDQISAQVRKAVGRHGVREGVLDELIAGRLTLVQAAGRFDELNAVSPGSTTAVQCYFAGDSDEERVCRQVIRCVTIRLADQSSESAAVLVRLEGEMQARFGHGSTES